MKVFISWSGELSKELAGALQKWLQVVLQHTEPYFSAEDIESGTRWSDNLAVQLAETNYGLLCLTKENIIRPWILFEAGALSKELKTGRVVPILFDDLTPKQLAGPLATLQAIPFQKGAFRKLIGELNAKCGDNQLPPAVLEDAFSSSWRRLDKAILEITAKHSKSVPKRPPADDLLAETLLGVRQQDQRTRKSLEILEELLALARHSEQGAVRTTKFDASTIDNLAQAYLEFKSAVIATAATENDDVKKTAVQFASTIKHFVQIGIADETRRRELVNKLDWVFWDVEAGDQTWGGSG